MVRLHPTTFHSSLDTFLNHFRISLVTARLEAQSERGLSVYPSIPALSIMLGTLLWVHSKYWLNERIDLLMNKFCEKKSFFSP